MNSKQEEKVEDTGKEYEAYIQGRKRFDTKRLETLEKYLRAKSGDNSIKVTYDDLHAHFVNEATGERHIIVREVSTVSISKFSANETLITYRINEE